MKRLYEKNELTFIRKNKLGKRYGLCKSAVPAGFFNTFANDAGLTPEMRLLPIGILVVIAVIYTMILTRMLPHRTVAKQFTPPQAPKTI